MLTINSNDHWLESLVAFVNSQNDEIPITLLTDGFLVTGNLVSGRRYFEHVEKIFPMTGKGPLDLSKSGYAREIRLSIEKERYSNLIDNHVSDAAYFHLIKARFYASSKRDVFDGQEMFFRGQIESVSGFSLNPAQF